jgi:hypothetical protein
MVPVAQEYVMRNVHWQTILGLVVGIAVTASAYAMHAHVGGARHAAPADRELLSISGSPQQLAARAERLAAHVCAAIEAGAVCRLPAIADAAAADLRALHDLHAQGQQALHEALLGPALDAGGWQRVEDAQIELIEAGSRRYLLFLVEASATLDAAQKQRFAH